MKKIAFSIICGAALTSLAAVSSLGSGPNGSTEGTAPRAPSALTDDADAALGRPFGANGSSLASAYYDNAMTAGRGPDANLALLADPSLKAGAAHSRSDRSPRMSPEDDGDWLTQPDPATAPVPEPATWVMMVAGFLAIGVLRRPTGDRAYRG